MEIKELENRFDVFCVDNNLDNSFLKKDRGIGWLSESNDNEISYRKLKNKLLLSNMREITQVLTRANVQFVFLKGLIEAYGTLKNFNKAFFCADLVNATKASIVKISAQDLVEELRTSVLTNRNIYILTSIERRHIEVYCNEDSINEKSMYMFFCELKKHVIRLIFADKLIPLHASCVYNKKKNIAILITGESNSGKSSTCWNLRQLGFECVADDIILYYDNHIHTAIEYLYITDDFKERFQINNSELVCAGRKHMALYKHL